MGGWRLRVWSWERRARGAGCGVRGAGCRDVYRASSAMDRYLMRFTGSHSRSRAYLARVTSSLDSSPSSPPPGRVPGCRGSGRGGLGV
jgi:hypothetical protein